VGAILTQNTNWTNVEKAIASLRAAGALSVGRLARLSAGALAKLIRPAGYFNVKARRLKSFIGRVAAEHAEDIEAFLNRPAASLREDLLSIHGIGPETADSIILYAAGRPSFVVDAYTRRVLVRHGLIEERATYDAIQALFQSSLRRSAALWNDYHAQLVAVGKHYCRLRARCDGCPLESFPHDPDAGR
jgi:endonuclease-3 related protein